MTALRDLSGAELRLELADGIRRRYAEMLMETDWDKRTLRRAEPCKECPFRKRSLAGYLGGHPLEPYRQPPSAGMPTTCHCTDKGADNPRSSFCAGSLAVIVNDPAVEPLPEYAAAAAEVGPRADCFATVADFADHHKDAEKYRVPGRL